MEHHLPEAVLVHGVGVAAPDEAVRVAGGEADEAVHRGLVSREIEST